jgi:hypothetical protein
VEGTTVQFDSVTTTGDVRVTSGSGAPTLPAGYAPAAALEVSFNGTIETGSTIGLSFAYDPAQFPFDPDHGVWNNGGTIMPGTWPVAQPRLLHYSATLGAWEDVTTCVDPISHTVTGRTTSLSPFAIVYRPAMEWSGVLQPINVDGSSVFKRSGTIPVKFKLTGAWAKYSALEARLYYYQLDGTDPGSANEGVSNSQATSGNLFRYDAASDQYIFNWDAKSLAVGRYRLNIRFDNADHFVELKIGR